MVLSRTAHLTYIDASFGGTTPKWYLVGKHVEEMPINLNPTVDQKKNILGENFNDDEGYTPTFDVSSYRVNPEDGDFYEKILDITMNRKTGDDCKTKMMEVIVADTEAESHKAWTEDVIVKPTTYAGGNGALTIDYTVYSDGNRQQGTAKIENKVPTFSAGAAAG